MRKAYTLIEMAVVISIIILMALIVTPQFLNYQKLTKLKNEARTLATNIRLGQQLAITEQNIYLIKLFPVSHSYQVVNSVTNKIVKNITTDNEVGLQSSGFTNSMIQFTPTGGVVETGIITLMNSRNQTSTIQIKPSGYVEISQ